MTRNTRFAFAVISFLMLMCISVAGYVGAKDPVIDLDAVVSNTLNMTLTVSEPKEGNGGGGVIYPNQTDVLKIVVDTGDGSEVSNATIRRTANADGTKKDEVVFLAEQAKETVKKAKESGQTKARIIIPDPEDQVAQLDLTISQGAVAELANGGLDLEIYTENARIIIPNDSLQDVAEDLYFRVVPIKDETERSEVEERARIEQIVVQIAGSNDVHVVARPMTIETNLSSRAVDIVLPLLNVTLPTDDEEREAFLADLVIFIEHSDGDKQLVKPEVVEYSQGRLGLRFSINKFSTFTILNMEGWEEYILAQEVKYLHEAYIQGYPDQTFRPDRGISRAEMAMILSRIEAGTLPGSNSLHGGYVHDSGNMPQFPYVDTNHWAALAIQYARIAGLMNGFPDGTFRPEQSITRAEMATIVSHWLGLREGALTLPDLDKLDFSDTVHHWAEKDIFLVRTKGIITGFPDGTYQPDKALTRAEAVTIINKILKRGSQTWTTSTWGDVPITHWAHKDIEEASRTHEPAVDEMLD